ncbi:MAG: glutamine amidotransferase [Myxococcota bacterium]
MPSDVSFGAVHLGVPGGWITAAVLAIAFGALVIWEFRSERAWLSRGLRIATAALAVLIAVQPRWTRVQLERTQGRLAVLVDGSRSMSIGRPARAARTAELLTRWEGQVDEAALLRFGSSLQAVPWDESATAPRDDESRLEAALEALTEGPDAEGLGGIVVVSDGALPDSLEVDDEVRIHAVHVGEDELRDDSLVEVQADPMTFLRQPAQVRVVVRSWGGEGIRVPVTLRKGAEVVTETIVDVPAGGQTEVELPFTPRRLGRSVYRVSIPIAEGDAVPANNERAFLVRVSRDRLRVLLVAGEPTWDVRFLRAFLKRDPSIDLISFFILRTTSDMTMASPDELALIPFPTDELFREHLGSFDVVLFQNFDYGPYQMGPYLPRIRDYVRRGGAFAMVGGDKSFSSGGYAGTPLEAILPVDLLPASTPPSRTVVSGRFSPKVVPDRIRHPLVALGPDGPASLARWDALPPLEGANVVARARPSATTLMTHPTRRGGGGLLPLLVLGEADQGRVLAFMADTSWRWGIAAGGSTGDSSSFERFWDRALRWLARDPSLEPARITTDRERYGPQAAVRLRALLRDESYRPIAAEEVTLLLRGQGMDGSSAAVVTDAEGRAEATLEGALVPGAYEAVALRGTDVLCREEFVVEAGGDEMADPHSREDGLRALAERTGGRFVASPEDAPSLTDFDATRTSRRSVEEFAPLAHPVVIALAALFFSLEWWIRRRRGAR